MTDSATVLKPNKSGTSKMSQWLIGDIVKICENRSSGILEILLQWTIISNLSYFYTLRRPVMREVLSTRIWGVPPACLGSRLGEKGGFMELVSLSGFVGIGGQGGIRRLWCWHKLFPRYISYSPPPSRVAVSKEAKGTSEFWTGFHEISREGSRRLLGGESSLRNGRGGFRFPLKIGRIDGAIIPRLLEI